ncbi:mucin-2-like [Discoglossus pictus]
MDVVDVAGALEGRRTEELNDDRKCWKAKLQYDSRVNEGVDYTSDENIQQQDSDSQQQQDNNTQKKQNALFTSNLGIDEDVDYTFVLVKETSKTSFIHVLPTTPTVKVINTAHNNKICSTWGNFHFKNFDGDIFYFPGTCNYVYSSHCKSTYEEFNIQIRRTVIQNIPVIEKITMKIDGKDVKFNHSTAEVDGQNVKLPFSGSGVQIEKLGVYLKVSSKLGLVFMWNDDDSLLLELDDKYANQTCGLCGDYNSIPMYNEFISNGIQITETQFGNLQKLDGPKEQCQDPPPTPKRNCNDNENICEGILMGSVFSKCHSFVGVQQYIEACVQDLCRCDRNITSLCLCDTFAEYSRQCAHAGGQPQNWRTKDLCREHLSFSICSLKFLYCHCVCLSGKWKCQNTPCPATCSIEGGSHIISYDQTHYNIHGDCNYVMSKMCSDSTFTILSKIRKCGLTESETCLKSATIILNSGETIVVIKPCGSVYINGMYTTLPISAANVTIFRPSSFYIIFQSNLGIQVVAQLTPFMQLYVGLEPSFKGKTCGLCGNFNDKQSDDFQTINGVIEGTAASFANTWKTQGDCPNVKNVYEDPCTLSVENAEYAQHWCGLISDPSGPFAPCHSSVLPNIYQKNCMFDTCNCAKSEDCMCAALSSYVRACAANGVTLTEWRHNVCTKYINSCPRGLNYTYSISTCQPTCRSLSEPDVTCTITFVPVDGCTCSKGFYMDDTGKCVPAAACPCYYKGTAVTAGEVVYDNGAICTCSQGKLSCIGSSQPVCTSPMIYFDCKNTTVGTKGAECQKSCQTLDMECYSPKCVSGCVCPQDLLSDGKGGCIKDEQCPCIHNDATYQPGEKINMNCNTCFCKNRMWQCTSNTCLGTCAVYGDGHYITFDGKRYSFNGDCEYTLVQDNCGKSGDSGTFRVITENIPCGTTGTTCSKAIKIFLGSYELILTDEHFEVIERGIGAEVPYKVRHMGIYLVLETDNGLILMWDKKTSIFIKLSNDFEGNVCGLCGDYDGNRNNDFTTRSMSVVGDVIEFGNSWKLSPSCPDAKQNSDPCSANPYRKSWALKKCSIINSDVFSACHVQVDPLRYYDACVTDSCACDTGEDCECFCTAIAAYAQACGEAGICVSWRTPNICPLFCDYYNPEGECEWHYKPCGAPCMNTCRNPSGKCIHELSGLEGCYPNCPVEKPYYNEDTMACVRLCECNESCQTSTTTPTTTTTTTTETPTTTTHSTTTPTTTTTTTTETPTTTTHSTTTPTTTTSTKPPTSTTQITTTSTTTTETPTTTTQSTTIPTSTTMSITPTTPCVVTCEWTGWYDVSYPKYGVHGGDYETYENIRNHKRFGCEKPVDIACRAEQFPDVPLDQLGQQVTCDVSHGLVCNNKDQKGFMPIFYNYQINVCCYNSTDIDCSTTRPTSTSTSTTIPTTITSTETPTTTSSTTQRTTTPTETPTSSEWTLSTSTQSTSETTSPSTMTSATTTETTTTTTSATTTETPSTTTSATTTETPATTTSATTTETPSTTTSAITTETPSTTTSAITTETPTTTTSATTTETPSTTTSATTTETPSTTTSVSTTEIPSTMTSMTTTTTLTTHCFCDYEGKPYSPGEKIAKSNCYEVFCTKECEILFSDFLCVSTTYPTTITETTTTSPTTTTETPTLPTTTTETTTSSPTTTETTTTPPTTTKTITTTPTSINETTTASPTTETETTSTSPTSSQTTGTKITTTSSTTKTSMVPSTTKLPGCPFEPHHKHNETWMMCNCTMARCLENNTVEIVKLKCEPPPMITCANGMPPKAVPDDDLCCWHWECDCVCAGWGDPHYITFDGTYYSYQDNCTYVLVEEIKKIVDSFGIYIDNYDCGASDRVSCPRNIIVRYGTQTIQIVAKSLAPLSLKVVVNDQDVLTSYNKFGVYAYKSGINYVIEIPELKSNITFNGLAFSIKLPYSRFGHNTHCQCGTCTNNSTDDCMTRSGEIISNCEIMADSWIVDDPRKPQCSSNIKTTLAPKVTSTSCKPSSLCDLIKGETFQKCHSTLPPEDFYQACIFDSCHSPGAHMECTSLQHYASMCADEGICIEWRTKAPTCSISCAKGKVYMPCGPIVPQTCQITPEEVALTKEKPRVVEGCFCPSGTKLFSSSADVCVSTCGRVGADNIPRQFGESFEFDCQDCVCMEGGGGGSGIVCKKHECKKLTDVQCTLEGFYPVTQTICKCNTSQCSNKSPNCGLGYQAV